MRTPTTRRHPNDESDLTVSVSHGPTSYAAVATIKNDRSGTRVTAYLVDTNDTEDSGDRLRQDLYQGIAVVWDQEDSIEGHDGPCGDDADHGDP